MSQAATREIGFSARNRTINAEDEIVLVSAGIDIGSATSHLVFSRIVMERRESLYVATSREILFQSDILLTPYVGGADIDADALGTFIAEQYRRASLSADDIDTGALILTGVAARRANAQAIGDLFAEQAGKFVAVSAGDSLETTLTAHGSGAVMLSARKKLRVMSVDVGGGTSKIAVCEAGEVVDRTVADVGARLICFDGDGRITAVETPGAQLASEAGVTATRGARLSEQDQLELAERLADRLFAAMGATPPTEDMQRWLRLAPLSPASPPDLLLFSGGVSEYLYEIEAQTYGDLGPMLANAIKRRAERWGVALSAPVHGIRATVIGASQYTVQLSGSTIFVTPPEALPLRNVPTVKPRIELEADSLEPAQIAAAIAKALAEIDGLDGPVPVALCLAWQGSATFERLDAFCRGVIEGLAQGLANGQPLVIVTDADIGGLIGMHCHEECGLDNPVISLDGIILSELDFIDVGELIESSGAVPVVIKSLVFPAASARTD